MTRDDDEVRMPDRIELIDEAEGRAPGSSGEVSSYPRRRRSRRIVGVVGGLAMLTVLSVVAVTMVQPWGDDGPPPGAGAVPGPATATPASPTGTATPPAPAPPSVADPDTVLLRSGLDTMELAAWQCDAGPTPPGTELAFRDWTEGLLGCLVAVHDERLPAGIVLRPLDVRHHVAPTTTACGRVDDAPAFFCPADATIHLDIEALRAIGERDGLMVTSILIHEFVHLVQLDAGILTASVAFAADRDAPQRRLRRIELQADCLAVGWLSRLAGADLDTSDIDRFRSRRLDPGDRRHGSPTSQLRWFDTGLTARSAGECNTWRVDADAVA